MNNINNNYKNIETNVNNLINFNKYIINQILYSLKPKTFILIDNYKEYHQYNV